MKTIKERPVRKTPGGETGKTFNSNYTAPQIQFNENRPPFNPQAETELLENLISNPAKVGLAVSIVKQEDFYSRLRANVYQRILDLHKAGGEWNLTTLADSFQGDPNFLKYRDFFDDLRPWTGELVIYNAQLIKDCSNARKLLWATYQANLDIYAGVGFENVRADLEAVLREVGQ